MTFEKTEIEGLILIKRTPINDERGYFERMYCVNEFGDGEIFEKFVQINHCYNKSENTLRGLHFQKEKQEDKVVSCIKGKIWDVCVDLRKTSLTYKKYKAFELSERNGYMLHIPKGCAHGYLTLEPNSHLIYFMSEFYVPGNDGGLRYDDPAFDIKWPFLSDHIVISEKDKNLPYME